MSAACQLTLFEEVNNQPLRPGAYRATKNFLSTNAVFFECFASSPTLRKCANKAARSANTKAGKTRNSADLFEKKLVEMLLEPATAAAVSSEVITYADATYPDLRLVTVALAEAKDKTLADIVVRYRTDKARSVSIATNIKRLRPGGRSTEGGSIPQLCQLALTEDAFDPADPPSPVGYDWQRAVLEWYADRQKIQDGRDYWLLVARVESGVCSGIEAWGVLSGMRSGQVIVSRHKSRAVIDVSEPTSIIDSTVDINAELSASLLPEASPSALRALITSLAATVNGDPAARVLAGQLLDLSDADLVARVLGAVAGPDTLERSDRS